MDHAQITNSQWARDDFCQFFAETDLPPEEDPKINPDVEVVLNSLFSAYKRLRSASYRIGYLEGQVKKYRQLLQTAPNTAPKLESARKGKAPETVSQYEASSEEKTWLSSVVEAIIGVEEPTGRGNRQGNRVPTRLNYYQLIRRSLEL